MTAPHSNICTIVDIDLVYQIDILVCISNWKLNPLGLVRAHIVLFGYVHY